MEARHAKALVVVVRGSYDLPVDTIGRSLVLSTRTYISETDGIDGAASDQ
ncbi:MAG: hypothetical protein QOG21_594 [Actinomycetota bacterium]|jgi:hypothetical protein|nr:hypothetical protein [Actinomycetota bacterium]